MAVEEHVSYHLTANEHETMSHKNITVATIPWYCSINASRQKEKRRSQIIESPPLGEANHPR